MEASEQAGNMVRHGNSRLIGFVIRGVGLSEEELSLSRFDDFLSLFRRNLLARFDRESI